MLIALYCEECPGWYPLPQGVPDQIWIAGGVEPSTRFADLDRYLVMHRGHDYRLERGGFRFSYSGGEGSWVLLQYGEVARQPCPSCGESISVEANFCPQCGIRLNPDSQASKETS